MSTPSDLDLDLERRLGSFLDEGPNRASERPIEAAMAHARSHPRRRDPLRALRRDPMARPWYGASPVGRSLVLVAALAALLATSFAVATIGGFLTEPAVVPPVATPSPSVSPSPAPSPTPTVRTIPLDERVGADATIEITDRSGRLVSAVSGDPNDGGSVPGGTVAVAAVDGDPASVQLTWTGLPCQTLHRLAIEPDGVTMALLQPACEGDTFPRDVVVILTFDGPVDPATLDVTSSVGQ